MTGNSSRAILAIMSSPQSVLRKSKLTLPSRLVLAGVIATIYIVACCCPALRLDHYYPGSNTPQSSETWFGWTALFLGWLGILVGSVAWLANFVLGLTVVFLLSGLRWASLICSALTLLLSLDSFLYSQPRYRLTREAWVRPSCNPRKLVSGSGLPASRLRSWLR
jgi:hypothetical protein